MNLALELSEIEKQVSSLISENIEYKKQLTKAIKIIKGLMSCCRNYPQENAKKMEQAEQFLKEIKVK